MRYIFYRTCTLYIQLLELTIQKKKWGFLFCFVNHYYPISRPRFPPDFCICGRKEPGSDHLQLFWFWLANEKYGAPHLFAPSKRNKDWNGIFFYCHNSIVWCASLSCFCPSCVSRTCRVNDWCVCVCVCVAYTKMEKEKKKNPVFCLYSCTRSSDIQLFSHVFDYYCNNN